MSAVTGGNATGLGAPGLRPPLPVPRRLLRLRSDAALAERYAAGDEAAFDVLYERHRPVVLAVCMGVLGVPHDAEDATQETFSALAQTLTRTSLSELRPWLTRVARNASIDTTRRRRYRLLTIDGELPDIPARPQTGAAELETVLTGIKELPESQRTALLMRELGGHSYAEIATFLETDEDAVRGLIARARVGLRTYREATEMPCASARDAIEAEPDGRRHDKTVRRHLRGCSSCRAYREALRSDAKALRALAPVQAGGLASGGLAAGGMMTAAKGALLGASISGVAASCAASVCAVGAVGGLVLMVPSHRNFVGPGRSAPPAHSAAAPAKATVTHAVISGDSLTASHSLAVGSPSKAVTTKRKTHHHRKGTSSGTTLVTTTPVSTTTSSPTQIADAPVTTATTSTDAGGTTSSGTTTVTGTTASGTTYSTSSGAGKTTSSSTYDHGDSGYQTNADGGHGSDDSGSDHGFGDSASTSSDASSSASSATTSSDASAEDGSSSEQGSRGSGNDGATRTVAAGNFGSQSDSPYSGGSNAPSYYQASGYQGPGYQGSGSQGDSGYGGGSTGGSGRPAGNHGY